MHSLWQQQLTKLVIFVDAFNTSTSMRRVIAQYSLPAYFPPIYLTDYWTLLNSVTQFSIILEKRNTNTRGTRCGLDYIFVILGLFDPDVVGNTLISELYDVAYAYRTRYCLIQDCGHHRMWIIRGTATCCIFREWWTFLRRFITAHTIIK
jgi:hypothetical protein